MKLLTRSNIFALLIFVCTAATLHSEPTKPAAKTAKSVQLKRLEVAHSNLGIHLLFDFVQNTQIKPTYNEDALALSIFFADISPRDLQANSQWGKLEKLHESGLLTSIELEDPNKATRGSTVRLYFPKTITAKDNSKHENQLLIKWYTVEINGTRLVIDAISKQALEDVSKQGQTIVTLATNDVVQNDFSPMTGLTTSNQATERRIVIDAGHGGTDIGATGCGNVCEKDIALQVSKLLAKKLKAVGYKVHLTRNDDRNVSLVTRSTLANQLKADAFISIHLNSSGKIGSNATGVETYFLAKDGVLPPTHVGGYYFVNTEHDQTLIDKLNKHTRNKIESSKLLATCVQNQLIRTLHGNNVTAKDRGVKSAHLRLLLRNNVPTALVEIGFITNRKEAAQLATQEGQEVVVDGISRGITRYFEQKS